MPVVLLTATTLVLCWAMFPPLGWWPLAYFALTPWVVSVCTTVRPRRVYVASYLLGVGYFALNVNWLASVTFPGYFALCLFFGGTFPLAAWPIRHMFRRHGASVAIALPIVWTGLEYLRSLSLAGFPWFLLAHTQYKNVTLIQISDMVGAFGVTFIVAMVNGWLTDLLIQPILIWRKEQPERTTRLPIGSLATFSVWALAIFYGAMTRSVEAPISSWTPPRLTTTAAAATSAPATQQATTTPAPLGPVSPTAAGPIVAIVQHDFEMFVDLEKTGRTSGEMIYEAYMALVREAAAQHPDLIVLPETAWPGYLNDEFLQGDRQYLELIRQREFPNVSIAQIETMRDWCRRTRDELRKVGRETGAVIVTGAASLEWRGGEIPPRAEKFNSAFLYSPESNAPVQRYDKVHLVLFGEFVPFRYTRVHWLYRALNDITPWGAGGREYSLNFGKAFTPFEFAARSEGGRRYRAGAPICYEDTQPYVARGFVSGADGPRTTTEGKAVDLLLNISNDGWFAHSAQLEQHLAASVFRAVENRVGVARSVNTGASAMIDPSGRIQDRVEMPAAQRADLDRVAAALQALRDELDPARGVRPSPTVFAQWNARLAALRSELLRFGQAYTFIADRLSGLVVEAAAGGVDLRTALVRARQQIDDDLATVGRWKRKPGTAPGFRVARLPVDDRHTIYSRWGDWFSSGCLILGAFMILDWLMYRIRGRRPAASTLADAAKPAVILLAAAILLTGPGCNDLRLMSAGINADNRQEIDRQALDFLLAAANDPKPTHRMHAIEALEQTAPREGLTRIRERTGDEAPRVQFASLMALGTIRDGGALRVARSMAASPDKNVRIAAIYAMHRLGDTSRTPELASTLKQDADAAARANAALALGLLGEEPAIKVLKLARQDNSETVRLQALDSMMKLGDEDATKYLLKLANGGTGLKMVDALMALGTARIPAAREIFRYRLLEGPYDEVRLASARGLGRLGRADGYDFSLKQLGFRATGKVDENDPPAQIESRIHTLAATALEAIGDPRALSPLRAVMNDTNEPMPARIAAARAVLAIVRNRR